MKKLFALLLAVVMTLSLCACGGGKPEEAAEKFAKAMIENDVKALYGMWCYNAEKLMKESVEEYAEDEDEMFEMFEYVYGAEIESWDDLYDAMQESTEEDLIDTYGEDYKIKVEIDDEDKMDEGDIDDVKDALEDDYEDYIDEDKLDKVKKGYIYTVIVTIEGEEDEQEFEYEVSVIKYDGEWKIADYEDKTEYEDDYDEYFDEF